uniref:Uncharacterized protein n=1 Tax=Avena sativa TaxID=4498 RepID=A0ACD5WYQ2_AVESA
MAAKEATVLAGSGQRENEEIEDVFKHLQLNEDELDDVVLGAEEIKEYKKEARWLAIGKVLTTRSFSATALFEKMKSVWALSRDPDCREAGENLFIFQMHCLGDHKKEVHQGPWTFRGWGVMIEDYDGLVDPEIVPFGGLWVWAQIHGIPELFRKVEVVDELSIRVGRVKEVQLTPRLFYEGNYVRIRVRIDVNKALMRFVSLSTPDGRKRLQVKYEKIPFFCKQCGLLGHDHEECGDGDWEENKFQYGTWMLATRRTIQPPHEPRRFIPQQRGGRGGRGGGRAGYPRKRSSAEASLDEDMDDTAESPLKPTDDVRDASGHTSTVRRLNMDAASEVGTEGKEGETKEPEGVALPVVPPPPTEYVPPRERNKYRKTTVSETDKVTGTSAASGMGDRRTQ